MKKQIKCYDTVPCSRCYACMTACSAESRLRLQRNGVMNIEKSVQLPMTHFDYLNPVPTQIGTYPNSKVVTAFHHCNHCEFAPCQSICPTGAITTRPGGEVVINETACIGCRSCGDACPFEVPRHSKDGKAYKCTGCYDRVENGLKQCCADTCPTQALFSGPADEVIAEAQRRAEFYTQVKGKKYLVYGADSLNNYVGKLRWITIAEEEELEAYKLDIKPVRTAMIWRQSAKTAGVIGLLAIVVGTSTHFMYWMHRRKQKVEEAAAKSQVEAKAEVKGNSHD